MSTPPVIVWFRRDLRLHDHRALDAALASGQPLIALFIVDDAIQGGAPRWKFLIDGLHTLDHHLRQAGGRLALRRGDPLARLRELMAETGATHVCFNRDYTPYARRRDDAIRAALPTHCFDDRLLVAPEDIRTQTDGVYTVYTPFRKKWQTLPKAEAHPTRPLAPSDFFPLADYGTLPVPPRTIDVPPAADALPRLARFMAGPVYTYRTARNLLGSPDDDPRTGTSALSPYIRFGMLSLREIRARAAQAYADAPDASARESVEVWMSEIIWHEFYTHILYHFPHVLTRNFQPKFDALAWRTAPAELDAWREGRTGYPVVDAAMRQLQAIGWMHNRARMIVASFLCKHLLIHWSEGQRVFMDWLIDGDPAANNGGWQWSAGTGTDAQPYFRIFNPIAQGEQFDPDGRYVRQWVMELHDVPDAYIHAPWTMPTPPRDYAPRIVDLEAGRARALAALAALKGN